MTTTNAEFAKTEEFRTACELAGVKATKRQASKFRRKTGRAYEQRNAARAFLEQSKGQDNGE